VKILKYLSLGGLLFFAMMIVNAVRFQYGPEDAFWRTLMTPFEGTVWAPGFKESEFSKVRVGMMVEEVVKLLGEPIRRSCDEKDCHLTYTWHDTATADYDQRWVVVDPSERVIEIHKSFFID